MGSGSRTISVQYHGPYHEPQETGEELMKAAMFTTDQLHVVVKSLCCDYE